MRVVWQSLEGLPTLMSADYCAAVCTLQSAKQSITTPLSWHIFLVVWHHIVLCTGLHHLWVAHVLNKHLKCPRLCACSLFVVYCMFVCLQFVCCVLSVCVLAVCLLCTVCLCACSLCACSLCEFSFERWLFFCIYCTFYQYCGSGAGGAKIILGPGAGAGAENKF